MSRYVLLLMARRDSWRAMLAFGTILTFDGCRNSLSPARAAGLFLSPVHPREHSHVTQPPVNGKIWPTKKSLSLLARKRMNSAASRPVASRPAGTSSSRFFSSGVPT